MGIVEKAIRNEGHLVHHKDIGREVPLEEYFRQVVIQVREKIKEELAPYVEMGIVGVDYTKSLATVYLNNQPVCEFEFHPSFSSREYSIYSKVYYRDSTETGTLYSLNEGLVYIGKRLALCL